MFTLPGDRLGRGRHDRLQLWQPPDAGMFTGSINGGSGTMAWYNDPDAGFVLDCGTMSAGDKLRGVYITAPATPWELTVRIECGLPSYQYPAYGIVLYDDISGRYQTPGVSARQIPEYAVDNWTNATTYASSTVTPTGGAILPWWRIRDDGTNVTWRISPSGKPNSWVRQTQFSRTTYLTNGPKKLGICGNCNASVGGNLYISCQYFNIAPNVPA